MFDKIKSLGPISIIVAIASLTGAQIDVIIDGIGTLSNTYE